MKKHRIACMTILTLFVISLSVSVSLGEEKPGDFLLRDFRSGQKLSFKDILTRKLNILVVTETTCYSCIKELQFLETLRDKYSSKVSFTVAFTDKRGWSRVKNYLDFYRFELDRFLIDETRTIPRIFDAPTVPTMIFLNRKGAEVHRRTGFSEKDNDLIVSEISNALKGRPVTAGTEPDELRSAPEKTPAPRTRGCASLPS